MSNFTPEQIQEILDLYFENFAHRQYIGARYVPIFGRKGETSIEWDNSAPYEPLTVVLHEGNSYTSRQFVPTGVAITNSAYWAETGNFNAQIEQYRQEVIDIKDQIGDGFSDENTVADAVNSINDKIGTGFTSEDTVADAVNGINGKIGTGFTSEDTVADAVNGINDKIGTGFTSEDTVADAVTGINSRLAQTSKITKYENLLCIGDSFGAVSMIPQGFGSWVERLRSKSLFANIYNYCFQGCGYITAQSGGDTYKNLLIAAAGDSTFDNADIDEIVIQGGINDVASCASMSDYENVRNSFIQAISDTILQARSSFPNARITVVPFTMGYAPNTFGAWVARASGDLIMNAGQAAVNLAECPWMYSYGLSVYCGNDGFHPNEAGADHMAGFIYGSIIGNAVPQFDVVNGSYGSGQRYIKYHGNTVHVMQYEINASVSNPNENYHLANVPDFAVPNDYSNGYHFCGMWNNMPADCSFEKVGNDYFVKIQQPPTLTTTQSTLVYSVNYYFDVF